jgi:hypothetical protein
MAGKRAKISGRAITSGPVAEERTATAFAPTSPRLCSLASTRATMYRRRVMDTRHGMRKIDRG